MSNYTEDDVKVASRAIARKNMPNVSEKLIDHLTDLGEWDDAAKWVLDAVAPSIAARAKAEALRDFAHSLAIARVISDHDPSQSQTSETLTAVIDDMFARADEIDAEARP